jgi:hypothetical protein
MAFDVGAIVAHLTLDNTKWNAAVEQAKKQQSEFAKKIQDNSARIKSFGRAMTIAGAAIVTGFAAITKKAIDANEIFSKFGVVFGDVLGDASKQVKNLTDNYGLSSIESKKLLSDTGDLLTGFGFTQKAALDLSKRVSELGVDLASFTNIEGGAEQAVRALSSAMLGETERAKALGIVIRQDSKEFINLVASFQKSEGMTLLQAKAMASLTIATKQSKNSIGDFARTQSSAANQARILQARFQDLIVEIGQKLVPIAQKLITGVQKIVTRISDWIKENPRLSATIIKITVGIGALMAVLGPLVIMLPNIAAGIGMIGATITATNPVLLAAAAAWIAITFAIDAFSKAQLKAMGAIVDANNREVQAIQTLRDFKKKASKEERKEINDSINLLVKEGKTRTEATIAVSNDLKKQSKAFKDFSNERNKIQKETVKEDKSNLNTMNLNVAEAATERKKITAGLFTAMTRMRNEFFMAAFEKQLEFEAFMQEQTMAQELLKVQGHERDMLRLEQEKILREQALRKQFTDQTALKAALESLEETHLLKKRELEAEHEEQRAAEQEKILQEEENKRKARLQLAIDGVMAFTSIFQNAAQARMNAIDQEFNERKAWIEENVKDETEREKQLEALEDEFSAKKRDAARRSAQADKAAAIMGAVVNTAQAITKAFAQGGIFGFASAAIMAAAGAVQIAAIKSQPIPLQQGGITQGPTQATIGDNPSGTEAVIPLERFDEVFGEQRQSMNITIQALDGASVERVFQTKIIPLIQNATNTENLLIAQRAVVTNA